MPESERSPERLAKEAQVLLGGGTASTARTIGFASYYIIANPEIKNKLQTELKDVMAAWLDKVPSWTQLENVEYLQAIIKESLRYVTQTLFRRRPIELKNKTRLSYGVMHRLPRISPNVPIQYKQYTIPPGVGVPLPTASTETCHLKK